MKDFVKCFCDHLECVMLLNVHIHIDSNKMDTCMVFSFYSVLWLLKLNSSFQILLPTAVKLFFSKNQIFSGVFSNFCQFKKKFQVFFLGCGLLVKWSGWRSLWLSIETFFCKA